MQPNFRLEHIMIRDVPPIPVAIMRHRGERALIPETARRFHAWRKANNVSPKTSSSFTVFRSEREPTDGAEYAFDLCVETDQPIAPGHEEVEAGIIPGGRCAVIRVDGTSNNQMPAAQFMYRDSLPASGE